MLLIGQQLTRRDTSRFNPGLLPAVVAGMETGKVSTADSCLMVDNDYSALCDVG